MMKMNRLKQGIRRLAAATAALLIGATALTGNVAVTSSTEENAFVYAAENRTIRNNTFWHDTNGNPIYSQGGGVFLFGDTYYWYGVHYAGAETYYSSPTKKNDNTGFVSVTCYSSKDLVNWKFENDVLTSNSKNFPWAYWFGRLGVAYNKNTKKYVLVAQHNESVLFASCSTPTGDFVVENIQDYITNVAKQGTGDQTIFIDDDGKAYLICSNNGGRGNQYVVPLRESDYLAAEPATRVANGHGREGNCMFKYKGKYYFCASDLHGWNSSHTYYMVADNIMGPYSEWKVMPDTDKDFSHVTQTGFFVTVHGSEQETVLYCGDRWSDFAGNGIGYNQWVPLSFNGSEPYFNSLSEWEFDATTGNWAVGAGNNYILNPSFDADRVSQTALAGWKNSGSGNSNASGARTGRFCMQQWADSAFEGTMYQDIELPNQTYTLKAWVKSSGGQSASKVYVKGYGGDEKSVSVKDIGDSWKEITISDIKVTNGKCQVGIYSKGNAGNWVKVDDFTLIGDGSAAVGLSGKSGATMNTDYSYTFTNKGSGLYLEVAGAVAAEGTDVVQGDGSSGAHLWKLVEGGGGYYYVISTLGDGKTYYLDLANGSPENGTNIGIWTDTACDAQLFKFVEQGDGTYQITTKVTKDESAIGILDASKDEGATAIQWACNDNSDQKWIATIVIDPIQGELASPVQPLHTTYAPFLSIDPSLAVGDKIFGDRDFTFTAVDEALIGAEYLVSSCDAKNATSDLATITAAEDVTLYIGFDTRLNNVPAWAADFVKTDMICTSSNDVTFNMYAKDVAAGETVLLGAQGQNGSIVSYMAMMVKKPETTTTTPPVTAGLKGDVNCDGDVKVNDVILLNRFLSEDTTATITEQGMLNAEVDGAGGVNGSDAIGILKILAGIAQ